MSMMRLYTIDSGSRQHRKFVTTDKAAQEDDT